MIRLMSPHFDTFEELFRDCDASLVLDYFYDVAAEIPEKIKHSEQNRVVQLARSVAFMSKHVSGISRLKI